MNNSSAGDLPAAQVTRFVQTVHTQAKERQMDKAMTVLPWRRMVALAVLAMLLGGLAGCTPVQQQNLSTFAQDFLRNLLVALAL